MPNHEKCKRNFLSSWPELFTNCKVSHALKLKTPRHQKQIIKSCSFGTKVTELDDLKEAIAMHAQEACKRLRDEESLCGCLLVFVQSSPFDDSAPFYNKSITGAFSQPTDSALDFVKAATKWFLIFIKKVLSIKSAA